MKKIILLLILAMGFFPYVKKGSVKLYSVTAYATDGFGEEDEGGGDDGGGGGGGGGDWGGDSGDDGGFDDGGGYGDNGGLESNFQDNYVVPSQPFDPCAGGCMTEVYVVAYKNSSHSSIDNTMFYTDLYGSLGFYDLSTNNNEWSSTEGNLTDYSNGLIDNWSFESVTNSYGERDYFMTPPTPDEYNYPDPNYIPIPIYVAPVDYSGDFISWLHTHMGQIATIDQNAIFHTESTTPRLLTFAHNSNAVRAYAEILNGPVDLTESPQGIYPGIVAHANLGSPEEYSLNITQPGSTTKAIEIRTYTWQEYMDLLDAIGVTPPPPFNAPPRDNLGTTILQLDALYNGVRTYVAPDGTPFVLPADAKVGSLQVDFNDFSNGAVYSFYLNEGGTYVHYIADESFWVRQSSNGNQPKFKGYYKEVGGFPNPKQPFVPTESPVITPGTNTVNVVRLRKEASPTGGCQMVQEVVTYTNTGGTTLTNNANGTVQNTSIERSPVVAGTTSTPNAVDCPKTVPYTGNSSNELSAYAYDATKGIESVKNNLAAHIKSSVKIYLYDCTTGQVKMTITKDEAKTLTEAERATETANATNEFNGNFNGNSKDIAIKGCLENGKWKYDVKYNPNSIQPHSKMAGTPLKDLTDEIKRQADEEVNNMKLKGVNTKSPKESITVDGELFEKGEMSIMESLSAIYDCGKEMINTGAMPENVWDQGKRANGVVDANIKNEYDKSYFKIASLPSGGIDELVGNATGAIQLVKTGLQVVRHPIETAKGVWNGVKSLNVDKLGQIVSNATGLTNLNAGGDRAKYQGGHYAVMAATIFLSYLKVATEGTVIVEKAGNEMTSMQKFIPDNTSNSSVGDVLKNAADNKLVVNTIDEEKLIAKNLDANGESIVVAFEKDGTNIKQYDVKASNMTDARVDPPVTYTIDDIMDGAKEVDLPKPSVINANNVEEITTAAGKKGGWNKELNKPKENKVYNVENSNTGHPHKYTTGTQGRVEQVDADLTLNTRDRNGYQQSVKCNDAKGGAKGSDQGGHLIGSRFDGAGEQINLVPMTSDLNLSQWKTMENDWAQRLGNQESVKVKIEVKYGDPAKPLRPTEFKVTETFGGVEQPARTFYNF